MLAMLAYNFVAEFLVHDVDHARHAEGFATSNALSSSSVNLRPPAFEEFEESARFALLVASKADVARLGDPKRLAVVHEFVGQFKEQTHLRLEPEFRPACRVRRLRQTATWLPGGGISNSVAFWR